MRHCDMLPLMPDLLTTAQVAQKLGKSPRTVHRLVAAGRLVPAMTAPGGQHGAYLFSPEAVEALLTVDAA